MATFVLVHGSWAGSVVWRELAPRLRKAGHEVYAPTLTGIGARKHLLNREIDLDTHIQDVIGVIDDADLSDIVLVGNSYGGMVITGVADRVPEKVASLVYLDAFVPENGPKRNLGTEALSRGTGSSNPFPSSGESTNFRFLLKRRPLFDRMICLLSRAPGTKRLTPHKPRVSKMYCFSLSGYLPIG